MDMKSILNAHALKSLMKPTDTPNKNLATGEDEHRANIPLLIFTEQHLPQPKPEVLRPTELSYEKVQKNGTGASLALDDFETQNFNLGSTYGKIGGV